jgi:hypothetical protein
MKLVYDEIINIGVVIGSLLAFRTTEFVIPNLEPRLCRPPNRPACFHDHLDDLVTYKTYSDIINYLNNPTTSGSTSSPSSRANNNERCNDNKSDDERNSLRRIATTSVNGQRYMIDNSLYNSSKCILNILLNAYYCSKDYDYEISRVFSIFSC